MSRILTTMVAVLATVAGTASLGHVAPGLAAPSAIEASAATAPAAAPPGPALVATAPKAVLGTPSSAARIKARGSAATKAPGSAVPVRGVSLLLTVTTSAAARKGALLIAPRTGSGTPVRVAFRRGSTQTSTVLAAPSPDHRFTVRSTAGVPVGARITVAGYVAPSTSEKFQRIAPVRVLDTRRGVGLPRRPVPARSAVAVKVTGGAVPAGATGVVLTLGATAVTRSGAIAVQGAPFSTAPAFASLRFSKKGVNGATVVARPDAAGRIHLFNTSRGTVHLTAVVVGFTTAPRLGGPDPGHPGAPGVSGLRLTSTVDEVTLRWTNPANATEVVVRRLAGAVAPASVTDGTNVPVIGVATSATDAMPAEGVRYTYSVFARVGGSFTPPASGTRPGPLLPTDGEATGAPGRLTFEWTNPPGLHHIEVSLIEGAGAPSPRPVGTNLGTAETYTATGLKERSPYRLYVYAIDAAGNLMGALSIVTTTPLGDDQAPVPLTSVTATAKPKVVTLAWTVPAGSEWDDVAVARNDGTVAPASPSAGWVVGQTDAQRRTIEDEAVEPGRTYTYALWVEDPSGNLSTRVTKTVTTPAGRPPGPVTGLRATALTAYPGVEGQSIRLSWTPPADAESFVVARADGPTAPTSTRAAGGWAVPGPTPLFLDTRLPGGEQYSYAVWAVAADGTRSPVATATATTDPGTRRRSGRLLNAVTGQPVTAGEMSFRFHDGSTAKVAVGTGGGYSVDLRVGGHTVCVTGASVRGGGAAHGYLDTCREGFVAADASATADVSVDPSSAVTGVVTDARTHQPLAGVRVGVWRISPPYGPQTQATTDANGRYVLVDLPNDGTAITVPAHGSELAQKSVDVPAFPAGQMITRDIVLDPLPQVAVSGRVTSVTSGAPLAGVAVHLVDPSTWGKIYLVGYTGADGRYAGAPYVALTAGLKLCFEAEGTGRPAAAPTPPEGMSNACSGGTDYDPGDRESTTAATTVTPGPQAAIALPSAATIKGTVRAVDGSPLAGVRVLASVASREVGDPAERRGATTDASGRYELRTPLPPGDLTPPKVWVCAQGNGSGAFGYLTPTCGSEHQVQPTRGQPSTTHDITMAPAGGISGVLTDTTTGRPVAGATVTVSRVGEGFPVFEGTVQTGADGAYTFTRLDPAWAYDVCFEGGDDGRGSQAYLEDCVVGRTGTAADRVQVDGGRATRVDRAVSRSATITGVVTDADTREPVAGIDVGYRTGTVTDAQGRFTLTGQPAGISETVRTGVSTAGATGYQAGRASGPTTLAPDAVVRSDVEVRKAAAVKLRVVTQDGRAVPEPMVSTTVHTLDDRRSADERGEKVWRGLLASPYDIEETVCATSGTPGPGSSVGYTRGCAHVPARVAGRTATVTVVVGLRGTIDAVVYDKVTGQPVPTARVDFHGFVDGQPVTGVSNVWTTDSGQASGFGGVFRNDAIAGTRPLGPTVVRARVCASIVPGPVTCVPSGSNDESSGPTVGASAGLKTVVPIGIDTGR